LNHTSYRVNWCRTSIDCRAKRYARSHVLFLLPPDLFSSLYTLMVSTLLLTSPLSSALFISNVLCSTLFYQMGSTKISFICIRISHIWGVLLKGLSLSYTQVWRNRRPIFKQYGSFFYQMRYLSINYWFILSRPASKHTFSDLELLKVWKVWRNGLVACAIHLDVTFTTQH
jgi:hypothetical protein